MNRPADQCPESTDLDALIHHYDIYDSELKACMYPALGYARRECPVPWSDTHGGFWAVTRYEDVQRVLLDPGTFTSTKGVSIPHTQPLMMPPIDSDPPLHRDFRRLLNRYLSRAGLEPFAPAVRDQAKQLVSGFAQSGSCEFMNDFARPFTTAVLSRVILDVEDPDAFGAVRRVVGSTSRGSDPEENRRAWEALRDCVADVLHAREALSTPKDDLLGAITHGTVDGRPLTRDERLGVGMVLMLGGLKTTAGALGNVMFHLTQDPELVCKMRDPVWSRLALDEFLRFESPTPALARHVTIDTEVGGQHFHAGDDVLVYYASANRDTAVFEHPDQLDFERQRNPHLSFGLGPHRCVGSNLARLQVGIAFDELLEKMDSPRLQAGYIPEREPGLSLVYRELPVIFETRMEGQA